MPDGGPEAYVIEVGGRAVGIVVRARRSFRFYASDHAFAGLENGIYCRPEDAERAAQTLSRSIADAKAFCRERPNKAGL